MDHKSDELSALVQQRLGLCADCPGFFGAVISTRDGLILASSGKFRGDAPAACAAQLLEMATDSLSVIAPAQTAELLIWTSDQLWCLKKVDDRHLLLAASNDLFSAGALRMLAQQSAQQLAAVLPLLYKNEP